MSRRALAELGYHRPPRRPPARVLGRSRTIQFRVRDHRRIATGELTLTFRRWRRPQARVGGRYRVDEGAVEVDHVSPIAADAITPEDARAAGFETPAAALEAIERNQRRGADRGAQLYRVAFHFAGPHVDPRKRLQADDELDHDELESLVQQLGKMDGRSQRGPWTTATLVAISRQPGTRAGDLAAAQGCETPRFKSDVRKLKALGLTISLEVGYELSPRGEVVLAALEERV